MPAGAGAREDARAFQPGRGCSGKAGGALQGNRVVNAPMGRVADLHLAIARTFGVDLARFGNDGTQPLPGVFT